MWFGGDAVIAQFVPSLPPRGQPSQAQVEEAMARARRARQLDRFRQWLDAHPPEVWENFIE